MLWGTVSKALQKCRETTSIALPLYIDVVTPSEKATRLVRQDLPLVKPCWLSRVTSLSSMCLSRASRRICSMIFPGTAFSSICALAFLTPSLHNPAASLYSSQDTCPCFHCLCISFLPFSLTSRAKSNLTLNVSRDGASTTSLGNLCQCFTTLSIKNFFLVSNLNLPSFSFRPLPLVLLQQALPKRLKGCNKVSPGASLLQAEQPQLSQPFLIGEVLQPSDTTQMCAEDKENDLTPPLEHCIRTKTVVQSEWDKVAHADLGGVTPTQLQGKFAMDETVLNYFTLTRPSIWTVIVENPWHYTKVTEFRVLTLQTPVSKLK
ncbi:hypothetical protein QYF61_022309, partial [Mycteria americana]